jgi:hypothetical protein
MDGSDVPSEALLLSFGWRLWRRFCLRGAGFPESGVLALGSPELARAVDRTVALEEAAAGARREAIQALAAVMHRLRDGSNDERRRVSKLLDRLRAHKVVAVDREALGAEAAGTLAPLHEAVQRAEEARAGAARLFEQEEERTRKAIREVAKEDRFREAVTWQNRSAVTTGLDALLRRPPDAEDSKTRRAERVVATYLQRYCVKADTIGFFGPMGWGVLGVPDEQAHLRPGDTLLAERTVYFERWAVDALAEALSELPGMAPWLAPRRHPAVPASAAAALGAAAARAFAACDGRRSGRQIAVGWRRTVHSASSARKMRWRSCPSCASAG